MKLRIEKSIYGGAGLARVDQQQGALAGKAVFIPLTLAGELVDANITEEKPGFLQAEVDTVLEPSLLRTTPHCPYFGACGGCSYQHAVYAHQLEIKANILRESLDRAHIKNLPDIHTLSGEPWHYRNRIRLHLQQSPPAVGYRERRSHQLLPVSVCPIAARLLEKAVAAVANTEMAAKIASFCNEIEFFTDSDEGSLLISFLADRQQRSTSGGLAAICNSLRSELPQLAGAAFWRAKGRQPAQIVESWGKSSLRYRAANFDYQVGLGSFFQINLFLIDALVEQVTAGRKGNLAWDLYAGVGLFARALTQNFERVIAVESSAASIADLRINMADTSHRVVAATTLDFLRKHKPSSSPPDLVVIDPPRAGLGPEITRLLSGIGPACIVYVSCDPATLSRDLAALLQSGYDLQTITMVDLFPQTFHLESVSVLTRR